MCRISGLIDETRSIEELESIVRNMCNALAHGGPDGEGIYVSSNNNLAFGHRRLALLDLSEAGKQPMKYAEERFVITYNGEIYNYPELKKELESLGHHFNTVCDTEMILAAFSEWGTECFKRFKGMFAIALLDNLECKVILARDPSGIKPLYFNHSDKKLFFASEVRALKLIPELNIVDENSKILLLAYGHIPEPLTTLKNVSMLKKGAFLSYDIISGHASTTTFNEFRYEELISDRKVAIEKIQNQLSDSVKGHLLSDAPIGVFLSGGIDSSLLALLAHEHSGDHLNTLSLYFNEAKFSEKKYQDLVIEKANCKHEQFLLTGEEFSKNFEQVINNMDMPCIDGVNTWFISKYAKASGLKAVLSGVGSDEMYGGYPSFRRIKYIKILKQLPGYFLRSLQNFKGGSLKRIAFLSLPGVIGEYLFLRGIFLPFEIAKILNIQENLVWEVLKSNPVLSKSVKLSQGNEVSWIEMNMYMQNQLLRDSDVMSMAHGIEIRVPFLDKDFVNTSLKITSKEKYSGLLPKQLLIDAFKKLLPEEVWNRPKMGFAFPFKDWLKGNKFIEDAMTSNDRYQSVFKKFLNDQISWTHVMAILVLDKKINETK